ncbi:MAG: protein kinase domain-containing protein, partial [Planctomycetota bacterium]
MEQDLKRLKAIFSKALDVQGKEERGQYLSEACGGDEKLRIEVEALLEANKEVGSFMETPIVPSDVTLENSPTFEGPGAKIGRYELLELIGEGGMGLVYIAQQKKPVKRKVALKIIRPGMDSKQVIARFEAEKQALAVLDHPNIAHVFDAGTTKEGRPYFVMEHVRGMSITRYCDENRLSIEKRLRLFEQVCEGIHHAHQKGIIHRDLKPSNIMVSVHGDRAVPKIIDFGIAKAVTQPLTEKTFVTFQGQLLGTPEYMSPEQVDLATQDVDTRSDIYSLGVVLYELLTGVLPFEREAFASLGFDEVQRTIGEHEPTSPSTRLTSLGEEAKTIAASRDTHVVALARCLHRELEWVPLKAMRKDRCRRYRSASELADDVRHYLNGLPLIAGPETAMYRMQKFVRKHAGSVVTATLVAVAIVLGLIGSTVMYLRSEKALAREAVARVQAEDAEQESTGRLAKSYVDRAQALCEQGQVGRGMLWLADSLRIAPAGSGDLLGRAVRTSLAAWSHQLHSLRAVVHYPPVRYSGNFTEGPVGSYTMSGSGIDIWNTADQFHFAYKMLTGPGSITVRVDSIENTHDWAKAGVMIRETLEAGSKHALTCVTPAAGASFQCRVNPNAACIDTEHPGITAPHWVKLERDAAGNFTASHSANGTTWASVENSLPTNIPMNTNVYVGLALTSHNTAKICKAIFSNVRTTGLVSAEWTHQDIGIFTNTAEPLSQNQINAVTFSPDGSRILAACQDGTVRLCDAATGQPIGGPLHHGSEVWAVAISSNGTRMATGSKEGSVRLWDAVTLEPVGEPMQRENEWNIVMVFSPDSSRLITGGDDGAVRLWDAGTGKSLGKAFQYTNESKSQSVRAVAYCPKGLRVVLTIDDGTHQMFDAERGEPIGPPVKHSSTLRVAISPDGTRFATAGYGSIIRVWEAATGKLAYQPIVHGGVIYALAFSPDGSRIVSGDNTRMALLWDAITGEPIGAPLRQRDTIRAVAFSSDGTRLVTGNKDGVVRIWDLIQDKYVGEPVKHQDRVLAAAYGPHSLRILTETNNMVQIRDAATGRPIGKPFSHPAQFYRVVFSP